MRSVIDRDKHFVCTWLLHLDAESAGNNHYICCAVPCRALSRAGEPQRVYLLDSLNLVAKHGWLYEGTQMQKIKLILQEVSRHLWQNDAAVEVVRCFRSWA